MTVIYSDDLINAYFGSYEEKIADIKILQQSDILERLDQIFRKKPRRYHLFENKAYIHQRHVISPYVN